MVLLHSHTHMTLNVLLSSYSMPSEPQTEFDPLTLECKVNDDICNNISSLASLTTDTQALHSTDFNSHSNLIHYTSQLKEVEVMNQAGNANTSGKLTKINTHEADPVVNSNILFHNAGNQEASGSGSGSQGSKRTGCQGKD